jgi:Domain of unknown function (DUF932)
MTSLTVSFKNISGLVRSDRPLTNDQILEAAPSVFAMEAHESRSSRYAYIPTSDIVAGLRGEGFMPFMVCQAKSRIEGKTEFTKHMIRFRYASQILSDTANEIILLNSHDGTSSYQMLAGCFRFVCHNGLICGETVEDLRIRHSGSNILDDVIEGAYRIVGKFEQVDAAKALMRSIELNPRQQNAFANAALALRYDPEDNIPILGHQLNLARRDEDRGDDLWRTFNRVQENIMQGGLQGFNRNGGKVTTRKVTGLAANVAINRGLWTLAEEMAKLV